MAKFIIQDTTLQGIADAVREIAGVNETLSPSEMIENLDGANNAIQEEANLIAQILLALEEKTNKTIVFYIDGTEYTAEKNMTWHEWCNSDYNTSFFSNWYEGDRVSDADDHITYNDEFVLGNEIIIANEQYITMYDPSQDM